MEIGSLLMILVRLIVPVTILRYPVGGFFASLILDGLYMPGVQIINEAAGFSGQSFSGWDNYHRIDKALDTYFLGVAAFVSLKWHSVAARRTAVALFALRLVGVVAFYITGARDVFLFSPNAFEPFYIYGAIANRWGRRFLVQSVPRAVALALLFVALKVPLEYFTHVREWGFGVTLDYLLPFSFPHPTIWAWFQALF